MFKNKTVPLSSLSQSDFQTHSILLGDNDLKRLSFLHQFTVEIGLQKGHSVSLCSPLEAEYLHRNLKPKLRNGDYLFVDLNRVSRRVAHNDTAVLPVTTFKLMLSALKERARNVGGDGDLWFGRAVYLFSSMIPYLESKFTDYKPVPGVDLTDSAMSERQENRVPMTALKDAMRLQNIKGWLLLQKDSPERENLYQYVFQMPGFESLTDSREEEVRHHAYLTMMGTELLNEVAPLAEHQEWLETLKTMMSVGRGHIVVSLPSDEGQIGYTGQMLKGLLMSEIRSCLGSHLSERVEGEGEGGPVFSAKTERRFAPFYADGLFDLANTVAILLAQMRAMGYGVAIPAGSKEFQNRAVNELISSVGIPKLILDKNVLTDFGGLPAKAFKLGKQLGKTEGLFIHDASGGIKTLSMFE